MEVHNTSEVLFHLCANTDPQRDRIFTKGQVDVLDHATREITLGSELGIEATISKRGPRRRLQTPLVTADQDGRRGAK